MKKKKSSLTKLHKREERLHHRAEKAMEEDEKVHELIERKASKKSKKRK